MSFLFGLLNLRTLFPKCLPIHLLFHSCSIVFPSLPFSPVHVCGGFHLQDSRRRLSPRSPDLWLQGSPLHPPVPASTLFFPFCHSGPRSFRRGLIHVFHLPRRLRAHFFQITRQKGVWSVRPCLIALDRPNRCNILALSLSL